MRGIDEPRTPRVSVVIASYRWPEALDLALQSALNQTVRDIEVIVVEDGRDRQSRKVVEEFGDPRVRWIHLLRNSGSQAKPNTVGRRKARAPVVAYLGHDDLWAAHHLETLLDALRREEADIAHAMTVMPGFPVTHLAGRTPATDREHVPPSSIAHLRDSPQVGEWPADGSGLLPVDYELMFRSRALGATIAATGVPTVLKIPAGWSLDRFSSRDVTAHRELAASLAADPEFCVAMAEEALSAGVSGNFPHASLPVSPGELSSYVRRNKGLRSRFTDRVVSWSAEMPLTYPGWSETQAGPNGSFRRVDGGGRAMVRFDAPRWPFFRVVIDLVEGVTSDLDGIVVDLDGSPLEKTVEPSPDGVSRLVADARLGLLRRPEVLDIGISTSPADGDGQQPGLAVRSIAIEPRVRPRI